MDHQQNVATSPGSIRNVDYDVHAINKLDKTNHERVSDSYRRYQKVVVGYCKFIRIRRNLKSSYFVKLLYIVIVI